LKEITSLNPRPAFVVHTGDVAEIGTARDYGLWQSAVRNVSAIRIHIGPGNHDVRWNPTETLDWDASARVENGVATPTTRVNGVPATVSKVEPPRPNKFAAI
jgi:3',5'-cyclic AMP phosphodiesterase CpdA